jgi:transposase-like protein
MTIKDIDDLKKKKDYYLESNGMKKRYREDFKEAVIEFHYRTRTSLYEIAETLGVSPGTPMNWKLKYGKQMTAYWFGTGLRNDLRTRCLAVEEVINGVSIEHLAKKYGVRESTINKWVDRYYDTYSFYIDHLPDGVPFLMQHLVVGNENVIIMRE